VNYHFIKEQAEYIRDQYEKENESKQLSLLPPDHENIRGNEYLIVINSVLTNTPLSQGRIK